MPDHQRIGLFGGTFDPIHLGHLEMARTAMEQMKLDHVRFIPCQNSPHKNTTPTSTACRLEMAKIATRNEAWATVDPIETHQPGASFSWKTAAYFKQQHPEADYFWIMGTDQWNVLSSWAEPMRLADCVEFVVCTRGENPRPQPDFTCHSVAFDHPASASKIRNDLAAGTPNHPWLDPEVATYIQEHQLYQGS